MTDDNRSRQDLIDELNALSRENKKLRQAGSAKSEEGISQAPTILVVDDNENTRAIVAAMIEELGYASLTAESANDAVDKVTKPGQKIDLILSDVVMPEEDGPDMIGQILKLRPDIKVIFMSGYAEDEIVHDSVYKIQDSSEAFLKKPFSLEELKSMLHKQMNE